jgi:hypothetical protein
MKIVIFLTRLAVLGASLTACSTRDGASFNTLYNYYFPKQGRGVLSSVYRPAFDELLLRGEPPSSFDNRQRQFYFALHGDRTAFRAFIHHRDREVSGSQGEEWDYESVLLLLRLGDQRFSDLLCQEDPQTREAVGVAIDPHIDWKQHSFPKTRALYSYRFARR